MAANNTNIGYFVQLGGVAAIVVGAILSIHHMAIAAAFVGGAAAFYVGEKIRALPTASAAGSSAASPSAPPTKTS
jgi:hypothetical protein